MQQDDTVEIRHFLVDAINARPLSREELEQVYGQVWDTQQLREDFELLGFMSPLVVVKRRVDGELGSLYFQHMPRFYFNYKRDE
jgi:hypothetical protein